MTASQTMTACLKLGGMGMQPKLIKQRLVTTDATEESKQQLGTWRLS